MAEETQKPAAAEAPTSTQPVPEEPAVVPPPVPAAEIQLPDSAPAPPQPEASPAKPDSVAEVAEDEKPKASEEFEKISQSVSFKEESNVVGELPESQRKALADLKVLIQEALNKHEFTAPPAPLPPKEEEKPAEEKKEDTEKPAEQPQIDEPAKEPVIEEPPKTEAEPEPVTETVTVKVEETITPHPAPETSLAPEADEKAAEPSTVVEKVAVIDEDGAKTVEAIEESVVAVSTPPPEESAPSKEEAEVEVEAAEAVPPPPPEEVFIWGIPLLGDERSDVILLKFLRARDFKVKDAFTMIKNTVRWRKQFDIEALLDEDLGNQWDKVVFSHGVDREGHPVCYNVFGEFENKDLYQITFSDDEKSLKFLRWRVQFLEKSIRKLDFSPNGISTIVQVNDLKNSPGLTKWELRNATKRALQLFQDNYPEFAAKQVFINVPWWYLAVNRMISPFFTQRTKSKFVFAGPSKTAETLFKYVTPEQVPVQYGGLSREGEQEFSIDDPVTEVAIKAATKHTVEFPISEPSLLVWELRVVGWDVSYGAEFLPSAEGGYTVIVQKTAKLGPADEPVISNSYRVGEAGKIVLTIDNLSSKKKKILLYRSKTKPISD
ncbi:patellin-3-like [Cucurbita pepo subsp. pepo]|uniref:Patellin 1 n=1 Tax=Cucurbita pepo TaxID=3663 RepID=Q2Q0V7_CUCPE|nr:patellin-3-like [Cucurbita pepo subsp. pepo]ABB77236.1 patellin 1 [Cucurbita pepo]